jgi:CDP-diacylglycerol--glycerol-3-phosphate 3-phosphatidyltransferase
MAEEGKSVGTWNIANIITIIRILCIPVIVVLLLYVEPEAPLEYFDPDQPEPMAWNQFYCLLAAILFVIASLTDYLDGYIARRYNLVTDLGKLLDPLADKLLVMAAMIMLVELQWLPGWMVVVIIGRELLITGMRSMASTRGIVIAASQAGKFKTAFQVTALSFLIIHYNVQLAPGLPLHPAVVGMVIFIIAFIFTLYSGIEYFIRFWPHLMK